ncbi:hypothetical protein KY313_02135 [Candidatus Woesearchaeota archaeon]|jgi:hypothetical protein|nr:hypothetical protein [Candidatus Woesearchaeota archaeon]
MGIKKSLAILTTSLFYSISPLKSQDSLNYFSNHWFLPDCKVHYYQSNDSSSIRLDLGNFLNIFYSQVDIKDGVRIIEKMEDTSIYLWDKKAKQIAWKRNTGDSGIINNNDSSKSVIDIIHDALENRLEKGTHRALIDESFKEFYIDKTETDSTVTLRAPIDYPILPINEVIINFSKKGNKLIPKNIIIDFPWYLTLIDYQLEEVEN